MIRKTLVMVSLAACGGNPSSNLDDAPPSSDATTGPDGGGTDGPTSSGDPAADGTATVTETTVSVPGKTPSRTLPSTVYTPSSPAPHPLVVISPGFQMPRTQYASYAHHLATWGFVVVLTDYAESGFSINHDRLAQDVPAVITWALAQTALGVDPQRIGTAGHSLGGKISIYAATLDPRIKAVVAWDPVDSNSPSVAPEKMTSMTAAVAVAGETTNGTGGFMPCAPAADNFATFYAAAPSPALALTVNGADHMDWVDDGTCTFCGFCDPGTSSPELARTVSRRLDVAWFRRRLLGDTAMDAWLTTPPELATSGVTIQTK